MRGKSWNVLISCALAWVMWTNLSGILDDGVANIWKIEKAYEAKEGCDGAIQRKISEMNQLKSNVKGVGVTSAGNDVTLTVGSAILTYNFMCLPENVDPRPRAGR